MVEALNVDSHGTMTAGINNTMKLQWSFGAGYESEKKIFDNGYMHITTSRVLC